MTPIQKKIYKNYIGSAEVEKAKRSTRTEMREWRDERRSYEDRAVDHHPRSAALGLLWKAVENLVKIGNHPDLFLPIEAGVRPFISSRPFPLHSPFMWANLA
jgi:hypothetical protein